jgi:orotidine-5'-phosphate decarboxylase
MEHFSDRLAAHVRKKRNSVCVGLDPRWDSLPLAIRNRHDGGTLADAARAYEEFCLRIIDLVAPLVPVVKPQSAFFEACGPAGMETLQKVIRHARARGLIAILDSKRNDIASTGEAYAEAALGGFRLGEKMQPVWDADAMTVSPYLGSDSIEPFLHAARRSGRGLFVLVKTSNPGASQFQDLSCDGRPVYLHVAVAVRSWTKSNLGKNGLGDVGAVVGATHAAELAAVRLALPEAWFLVPGFGAQGAGAQETSAAFRSDGLGAIVNSSRGIIFPFQPDDGAWEEKVVNAARVTIDSLAGATPMGKL